MPFATASFTIVTASPTSTMVHSFSPPIAPTAVMKASDAFVGSSVACVATDRTLAIRTLLLAPSARFFDHEPKHRVIPIEQLAGVAEIHHERRNRLSRRVVGGG